MKELSNFISGEKSLLSGNIDFSSLPQIISDIHSEKILKMTGVFSNFMTEVHEEEKLIILTDIVGFSKDSTRNQVYKIYLFQRYLTSQILTNKISSRSKIKISHFVPTGDGCYIIADKCDSETALSFLISLVSGFKNVKTENNISLSIRASALFGKVVPFFDMAKHLNYIGEGMNEAARILSCGQKELENQYLSNHSGALYGDEKKYSRNSLYLGDSLIENIANYKDKCRELFSFQNLADKHGLKRNVTVLQGIF
ncbi:MAG: hypothetical protein K5829_08165 [Treponema sp.]|nr:hypothetical protein [Treponema sp.]